MKKSRELIAIAVLISIFLHCVFFASSRFIMLPGMQALQDESKVIFRINSVEETPEEVKLFDNARQESPIIKLSGRQTVPDAMDIDKMFITEKLSEENYFDEKKEKMKMDISEEPVKNKENDLIDVSEVEKELSKKDAEFDKRTLNNDVLGTPGVALNKENVEIINESEYIREDKGFKWTNVIVDVNNKIREKLFTPGHVELMNAGKKLVSGTGMYEDISSFLDVTVKKYIDNKSGDNFFEIRIKTKKGVNLKIMPKEVTFLIDSSKSVTEEKLDYVKLAVIDALRELNPYDRFNVIAFREKVVKLKPSSIEVSNSNILEAVSFIKDLHVEGATNVEDSLLTIVNMPVKYNPSYIFLITDGRPTAGMTNSRRLIREITRHNDMKRPIFSFGGGARVNRYLLDFISYQNRAWSYFAERRYQIPEDFNKFFMQVRDPLLLNVRYRLINVNTDEVYPKNLPDFYKGSEFVVYGKFDKEEDEFSMQVLGEINGETKELIFKESFEKAELGTDKIARDWAFRKIYYLISQDTIKNGKNSVLREEIEDLSKKYKIVTPYDIDQED